MSEREAFEAWAKQPPMEWDCERYTENEAWPGNYRNYPTQCAWDGWQAARAQPAQAVPASCGECGKKTSDGWALYCVACMEKAGLPAQAGPLLDAVELMRAVLEADQHTPHTRGTTNWAAAIGRAIEQAVRAKLGVAVPMTDEQIDAMATACKYTFHATMIDHRALARAVERHHGIVGKEGA